MAETQEINHQKGDDPRGSEVGEMSTRRERMADGRRYIIYYTFAEQQAQQGIDEEGRDV